MFTENAKVQVKNSQGQVIATQEYNKIVFEGTGRGEDGKVISSVDVTALLKDAITFLQKEAGEKGNGVLELLKNVTYAYDLGVRAGHRQTLVTAAAGPDKAIEKAIKDLMAARAAAGKPMSEEIARAKVLALMAD